MPIPCGSCLGIWTSAFGTCSMSVDYSWPSVYFSCFIKSLAYKSNHAFFLGLLSLSRDAVYLGCVCLI